MRALILHIGMNKTGSTAVQAALARARAGPDWAFVAPVIPNASNVVRLAFHPNAPSEAWRLHPGARSPEQAVAAIDRALAACDAPRGVMSGEGLFRLGKPSIRALVGRARSHADHVQAVAYVRPPAAFMVSSFQQRMKTRHIPLHDLHRAPMLTFDRAGAGWEDILGAENVTFRPYDRQRLPGESVIADFAEQCDLGPLPASRENNAGLSGEAMRLLLQYRRRVPRMQPRDREIISALQALGGARFAIAPALLAPARAAADRMRDWALDRMGWDMAEPPGDPAARPVACDGDFDDILPETVDWLAARTGCAVAQLRGDMDAIAVAVASLGQVRSPVTARAMPRIVPRVRWAFGRPRSA